MKDPQKVKFGDTPGRGRVKTLTEVQDTWELHQDEHEHEYEHEHDNEVEDEQDEYENDEKKNEQSSGRVVNPRMNLQSYHVLKYSYSSSLLQWTTLSFVDSEH